MPTKRLKFAQQVNGWRLAARIRACTPGRASKRGQITGPTHHIYRAESNAAAFTTCLHGKGNNTLSQQVKGSRSSLIVVKAKSGWSFWPPLMETGRNCYSSCPSIFQETIVQEGQPWACGSFPVWGVEQWHSRPKLLCFLWGGGTPILKQT